MKNKIESFSSRFSIFYYSMSSDYDLSHVHTPRNPRLVANNLLFVFLSAAREIKYEENQRILDCQGAEGHFLS